MIPSSCPHAPGRRKRVCNRVVELRGRERGGLKVARYKDLTIRKKAGIVHGAGRRHGGGRRRGRVGCWVKNLCTCQDSGAAHATSDQHFARGEKSSDVLRARSCH